MVVSSVSVIWFVVASDILIPPEPGSREQKACSFQDLSCLGVKPFPQIPSTLLLTFHWKVHRGAWGNLTKGSGVDIAPVRHMVSTDENQDSFRKEEVGDECLLTYNKSYLPHVVKLEVIYWSV